MTLDAAALAELYRRGGPALLVYATRRTLDAELALDVVGETFAAAFAKRTQFRGSTDEEAIGWLYAICRTVISHHYRRSGAELRALRRLHVEPPTMGDDERRHVEELAGLAALHEELAQELTRLPAEQRQAVALRVVEELGYQEIAERLGITQTTARARVSRGLRELAQRLTSSKELADVR